MLNKKYHLRYLSLFEEDLYEIVDYIALKLRNSESALKLVDKIEKAILERLNCPLAFESFPSTRPRKNPYYRIYVDNFVIFYVVLNDVMEVRRILYKGRNSSSIIK